MSDKTETSEVQNASQWFLYMVRCKGDVLYTGITTDVKRRFAEHQSGKGAKFLRGKTPLALVFQQEIGSHSDALKLELIVKKWSKAEKENVVSKGSLPH